MLPRRRVLRLSAPIFALSLALAGASAAAAHAELVRAIPADGETVTEPVTVISGRYSEDLVDGSRLVIKDPSGTTVATGVVDPDDDRRMVARPETALTDGAFTVESTARSADGHVERVTWTFTVSVPASPTATASPTASPEPSLEPSASVDASPTASPTPTASPAPSDSTSGTSDVLIPIIAALAIVAVGAGILLGRSRRP
jgi:methionine-rich copper-binding protein CopC